MGTFGATNGPMPIIGGRCAAMRESTGAIEAATEMLGTGVVDDSGICAGRA